MPSVHGTVGKDMRLVALEIGSIFLDSNLVTCNKNRKTVHTLWPGNSTLGNKPKERNNLPEMLNTPLFAWVKMGVLCFGGGDGGGDGSRKLSQAIDKLGLHYSVIISGLPAFTEMEEMTSGGQSRDWKVRKRAKCPSDLFFMSQWKVGKPPRLTLVWTSKPSICFLSSSLFVYRS